MHVLVNKQYTTFWRIQNENRGVKVLCRLPARMQWYEVFIETETNETQSFCTKTTQNCFLRIEIGSRIWTASKWWGASQRHISSKVKIVFQRWEWQMAECFLCDWRRYRGAWKELSCFPTTCYKGTTRLRTVLRAKNLKKHGNAEARAQNAVTRGKIRKPTRVRGPEQFQKKWKFSFSRKKSKANFMTKHRAPLRQYYCT